MSDCICSDDQRAGGHGVNCPARTPAPVAQPLSPILDGLIEEVIEAIREGDAQDCSSPDCIADAVYEIVRVRVRDAARSVPDNAALRRFPIQKADSIPWGVAQRAYEVYAVRYGTSQSLERLAERGGFGVSEMDEFLPGWRDLAYPVAAAPASPAGRIENCIDCGATPRGVCRIHALPASPPVIASHDATTPAGLDGFANVDSFDYRAGYERGYVVDAALASPEEPR